MRPINGSHKCGTLSLPPVQTVDFGTTPAIFGLDFFAETTIGLLILSDVDESHTACLAGAIFIVASVGKAGPAPVSTRKSLLVVKAHAY